jgi:hypothetical protein
MMGRRMFPSCTDKHDMWLGYQIDQGCFNGDRTYSVVMQRNGRPHGEVLVATVVDLHVDRGENIVKRLEKDAEAKGNL